MEVLYLAIEMCIRDRNTAYQMDSVSGDAIITVTYENHPVKGKLVIHKSGETLKSFKICV